MDMQAGGLGRLGPRRRAPVSLSSEGLVSTSFLADCALPLLFRPAIEGVSLATWLDGSRDMVREKLLIHGAVLFRGFLIKQLADFEQVVRDIGGELLEYSYASTPRTRVAGNIYSSTEYPASQEIPLHNEMAYTRHWPMKLGFYSIASAPEGGETPLADSRRVLERIDPVVRDRFANKQVMYVRNYSQGLDLPWQDVFQTADRDVVADICRQSGIEFEWQGDDGLTTRQVCQGVATHPVTGEAVWFNQAHLFHISSLAKSVQESLLSTVGEDSLPRNAYYGDGSPIDPHDLDGIRQVYKEESVAFTWQDGDVLIVENMLAAHGRRPFAGHRQLVVGMSESSDNTET